MPTCSHFLVASYPLHQQSMLEHWLLMEGVASYKGKRMTACT